VNAQTTNATAKRKALLLIGSPKGKNSTSFAIGGTILRKLEAAGMETEELTVATALQSAESRLRMFKAVDAADLVIVAFPLYVDQLPSPLIQALELIAERGKKTSGVSPSDGSRVRKIAAVVQCGFPETHQNQPAVDIVRRFAKEAGFQWAGALAMGMGGAVAGRPLEKAGGMVRNVVKAIDLAAASLAAGGDIPEEAAALMGRPIIAKWIYLLIANFGMKSRARKHGVRKRVYDRPYAQ
jgi:putative NADPH-quinone reductase